MLPSRSLAVLVASTVLLAACTAEPAPSTSTPAATTPSATTPTAAATTPAPAATTPTSTASTGASRPVIVPPSPDGTRYNFACAEGKTFSILAYPAAQERVTLMVEGKTLELKQERQGSGTRHSNGEYTLIQKGVDAFIEQDGRQTYRDCTASRP
ncbi:MAG: MliC family protein [Dehalococcoidia bacterium]